MNPFRSRTIGRYTSNGHDHRAWVELEPAPDHRKRPPGTILLCCAALLLFGLAVAQGYVSWRAQYNFVFAAKREHLPSVLEALGLDTGAVIFALLGLAHARMGRPARIERTLNLACAFGSMTMNLLGADLGSPRSVAVYVLPALLYAACSDRLIATAGHAAGVEETSLWRLAGMGLLYGLRVVVAFPSTALGLRRALLLATPLPAGHRPENRSSDTSPDVTDMVFVTPAVAPFTDAESAAADALARSIAGGNALSPNALQNKYRLTRAEATRVVGAVTAASNGHAPT
jgi:hypothetical protein